jgi:branched-chain amino acid transport system permease protein
VSPSGFTLLKSIEVLLVVVLGGMGSLLGSACAAVILGALPYLMRHIDLTSVSWLPDAARRPLSEYNMLLYALLLIVLMRLVPDGILGMRECPRWLSARLKRRKA